MAGRHPAAGIDGPAGRVCASAGKSLWGACQGLEEVALSATTTEAASRLTRRGCAAGAAVIAAAGHNKSEALKWRSHTSPEAVACSVPDLVMCVGITDEVRREHDTAGGYEHEP